MFLVLLFCCLLLQCAGCTGAHGRWWGLPSYEERGIAVEPTDLDILMAARQLLRRSEHWEKDGARECAATPPHSLFCALHEASIAVTGTYTHRQAALQEVRFVVDDHHGDRWTEHRLADFNAHEETTHQDVIAVLDAAIGAVRNKLERR